MKNIQMLFDQSQENRMKSPFFVYIFEWLIDRILAGGT